MRLALILCLVATPVWAQAYPSEAEPLIPIERALAAVGFNFAFDTVPATVPQIDRLVVLAQGVSIACADIVNRDNTVIRNSGQNDASVRLVGCLPTTYVSSGNSQTDLTRVTNRTDGYLDDIHALRQRVGADQVVLVSKSCDSCGIGWMCPTAVSAFTQVCDVCVPNWSATHELGHNLCMAHDKPNAGSSVVPYGFGYRSADGQVGTVMAYGGGRMPQFSNPAVPFLGRTDASGTATADNARVLREKAAIVAGFVPAVDVIPPPGWPENAITVTSDSDAAALRLSLIQQIWGCASLPNRLATVTVNVGTGPLESPTPLPNVQRVDRYSIKTYGQTLSTYLIRPVTSSGRLAIVTLGHAPTGTLAGLTTSVAMVTEALVRGSTVLLVPMPLGGTSGHDVLGQHAYEGFSPLQYFLDSAVIALNTYLAQNPAPSAIVGMGVSGGGWGLTLLGTIDPRYTQTFGVAGSLPLPVRSLDPSEYGDWEQRLQGLTGVTGQPLDYLDLYLAAASDGRFHAQINNQTDTCCFSGTKDTQYVPQLTAVNPRYTFTRVSAPQHGITAAQVTSLIGPALGPVLVVPPVSYASIIDNGNAGFSVTGPNWYHRTDEGNAYQGDIHHVSPGCGTGGTGTRQAQWVFTGVPDADVTVKVTWSAYQNRATNTPFVVKDGNGNVLTSAVYNQQLWPIGTTYNGKVFQFIGTVRTATGSITVQMTDNANACVIADAVRVSTN